MPQLVNSICAICGKRITTVFDAEFCSSCSNSVHKNCKSGGDYDSDQCDDCGSALGQEVTSDETVAITNEASQDSLLTHLFSPNGRVSRETYIAHSVLDGVVVSGISFGVVLADRLGPIARSFVPLILLLIFSAAAWSEIAITIKRLHDVGRPGG